MRMATKMAMAVLLISAFAAPLASADEALTLQKARELVLSKSTALRKAELSVDEASLAAQAQGYAYLPSLSASASGSLGYGSAIKSLADGAGASAKLSASETLFDGGKTQAMVKKSGIATESARETLRGIRVSLIGDADSAFFSTLAAAASVDAASSDLDAAKLRLQIAQAKADAGALSKSDLLQTEAETAAKETTLISAQKNLASAKAKLASLTGLPASAALQQIDFASYDDLMRKLSALDGTAMDKLASDIGAMAEKNSPTLSGYALASGQALQAVAAAKAAYLPTVAAGFSQGFSYGASSGYGDSGSLSVTASLSLDLWNTKNEVASATVAARQAELDASAGKTSLELSVTQAVYEWLASARAVSSSAKALEYAESNYANVLEKFKLSAATASDLSTAEALVSADKTALIGARYAFLTDLSTLRGYAGLEDEAALLAALQ
jgi:outer membrane protein